MSQVNNNQIGLEVKSNKKGVQRNQIGVRSIQIEELRVIK